MVNFPELEVLEIFQETGRANISFQEASGSGCVDELLFFFFSVLRVVIVNMETWAKSFCFLLSRALNPTA